MTRNEEILEEVGFNFNDPNTDLLEQAMEISNKEHAVGFFKYNAKVISEYIAYMRKSDSALGASTYEEEMNWYEGVTLESRYDTYIQEQSKREQP